MDKTDVVIAGGGPVGMTLAYMLAEYGVRVVLLERNPSTTTHPKMDITNARSMELFAKIGLSDRLRAVAVAEEQPFDVSWITTLTGHELHRFVYPGVAGVRERIHSVNDGTQGAEPPMRVSQVIIEPVLKQAIDEHPLVDVRFGVNFDRFEEDGDEVISYAEASSGEEQQIRSKWLVGCDGGGSRVRTQLGIEFSGRARVAERFITHFRSNDRDILQRWGAAWHYQSSLGTLVAQNDHDVWTLLTRFPVGTKPEDVDPSALIETFVGRPIEHEIIVCNHWAPHLLVADSYGRDRVLLAGDAVHQYIPTGGYGMNTGIGDAFDLGWKLAATIKGFGGADLLASYEIERRPVGFANCAGSGRHNDVRVEIASLYTPTLFEESPEGEVARAAASRRIAELGNNENESFGLEFGYAYVGSPIVVNAPGDAVSTDPITYVPSTTPGARLPSIFLADGSNVYDHLGEWFTLLTFAPVATKALADAAREAGVPLAIVQLDISGHEALYPEAALLVRPDQHIAWRGSPPTDAGGAAGIIAHVSGNASLSIAKSGAPATV
ncbi:FAD-dependent oxidoreductase [soil metagenome]